MTTYENVIQYSYFASTKTGSQGSKKQSQLQFKAVPASTPQGQVTPKRHKHKRQASRSPRTQAMKNGKDAALVTPRGEPLEKTLGATPPGPAKKTAKTHDAMDEETVITPAATLQTPIASDLQPDPQDTEDGLSQSDSKPAGDLESETSEETEGDTVEEETGSTMDTSAQNALRPESPKDNSQGTPAVTNPYSRASQKKANDIHYKVDRKAPVSKKNIPKAYLQGQGCNRLPLLR